MVAKRYWPAGDYEGYSICWSRQGSKDVFDLEVESIDSYYGSGWETLNALEVYRNLKEYFKGTEYE